jgi:hypothetical protein
MRRLTTLLYALSFALPIWLLNGSCGQPIPPTGGPRDTIPPVFIGANPKDSALNVRTNRLTLVFNEYISVDRPFENVIISPVPKSQPQVDGRLKEVQVRLRDTLEPNTTYTIDFGNSIRDINENNVLRHFTYTFSTGDHLDSGRLYGKALLADTGLPDTTITVLLHRSADDSAIAKERPRYYTRTNRKGEFVFRGLAPGTYHAFALKEGDNSRKYDQPSDMIGFLDTTVTADQERGVTFYVFKGKEDTSRYKPMSLPKPKAPAPPVKKDDKRFKYQDNLENSQQDLLGRFSITFANPFKTFDTSRITLTDEKYNRLPDYQLSFDSARTKVFVAYGWKESTLYKVLIKKGLAADSLGNEVLRNDTISVNSKRESDYAALDIKFTGLDSNKNPVLILIADDKLELSRKIDATRIKYRLFHPGEYLIRILYDRNNNGIWDTGDYWKKLQPEIVVSRPQKWGVRANMENELTINLSEGLE